METRKLVRIIHGSLLWLHARNAVALTGLNLWLASKQLTRLPHLWRRPGACMLTPRSSFVAASCTPTSPCRSIERRTCTWAELVSSSLREVPNVGSCKCFSSGTERTVHELLASEAWHQIAQFSYFCARDRGLESKRQKSSSKCLELAEMILEFGATSADLSGTEHVTSAVHLVTMFSAR